MAERLTLDRSVGHTLGILDADILEERVMKLVETTPRTSARVASCTVALAVSVLCLSSVGAGAMGFRMQDRSEASSVDDITGTWVVTATQDGDDPAKRNAEADAMMRPELTLRVEDGKLVGTVVFPKVIMKGDTPTVEARDPVAVTDPVFQNGTFTFKVHNGEEFLIGEVTVVEGGMKGRWISEGSKLSGTLFMKRAE